MDDIWSCDLVEIQDWSKENKGFRYVLNVVDVFSKCAWSIPLKDKTGKTVLEAFNDIVKSSNRKPKHIWVNRCREFYNGIMDAGPSRDFWRPPANFRYCGPCFQSLYCVYSPCLLKG